VAYPTRIDVRVKAVEQKRKHDDQQWHSLARVSRLKWKDVCPVDVMALPEKEKYQWNRFCSELPHAVKAEENEDGWRFHD
jgi:hypothetical protein